MCTPKKRITPVELSNSLRAVMKAKPEWTVKKLSKEIGLSKSYIYKLLKLTEPVAFYGGREEWYSGDGVVHMDITSAYPTTPKVES